MSHMPSHLAAFDSDPVLARTQESLSPGGSDISAIAMAGSTPVSAGGDIFNTLVHLAVNSSRPTAPMATSSSQPSSAAPAIGAGIGGLAMGAGLAGAALAAKGKPMANTVHTAPTGGAPVPPAKIPGGKPGTVAPAPKTGTTPIPVPGIPEKFVAKPPAPLKPMETIATPKAPVTPPTPAKPVPVTSGQSATTIVIGPDQYCPKGTMPIGQQVDGTVICK